MPPSFISNASPEDRQVLESIKRIVTNVRRDEQEELCSLVYDENSRSLTLGFFQQAARGSSGRSDLTIYQRINDRLADFILLGHEQVGSFSLASSKTHLFSVALGTWLNVIAAQFNRIAIPRLFALNSFRLEKLPKLVPGDIEVPNLTELGDYITKLAGAGMDLFPDEKLEDYLQSREHRTRLPSRRF